MSKASFWWCPANHAERRPFLLKRAAIATAARHFFAARDFIEVDTAALQVSPGNETHLSAFATEIVGPDGGSSRLYLHSSPEFAAKKLLTAGEPRFFSLTHVFRNRERGVLHHPEFTMLEWYRAGEPYDRLFDDCRALLAAAAAAAGADTFCFRDRTAKAALAPDVISVAEAFQRYAGVDLLRTYDAADCDRDALAAAAESLGLRVVADDTWSDLFSKIFAAKVEAQLGNGRPTLLVDYPAPEAALAQLQDDSRFAERFELYVCGVELANGFGELTDADVQRRRFEAQEGERRRIYGDTYPIDTDFIAAVAQMPPACGIALGFDRLVMLATGARRIDDVLWTPVAETGTAL